MQISIKNTGFRKHFVIIFSFSKSLSYVNWKTVFALKCYRMSIALTEKAENIDAENRKWYVNAQEIKEQRIKARY